MKIAKVLLASVMLLTLSVANAGIITIDTFDTDQQTISAKVGETVFSSVNGAGILGGYRDLVVTNYGALNPDYTASIGVAHGNMSFSAGSTVEASFWMQWDGDDNSASVDTDGLMGTDERGINLIDDGLTSFMTETVFADANYLFDVEVWWDRGRQSERVTILGPGHSDYMNPHNAFLNFDVFEFADLTDVTALVVGGNVAAPAEYFDYIGGDPLEIGHRVRSFDVTVGSITAVPEPHSVGLMGLLLVGMAVRSQRKNKQSYYKEYK